MPRTASVNSPDCSTDSWKRWEPWLVLGLIAVVLATRWMVIESTATPARDMFRYLDAANQIEAAASWNVLTELPVQPLYPLSIWFVRRLATLTVGPLSPVELVTLLQAWSSVCYVGFLLAAYSIGRRWLGVRPAFLGCLIVALLPRQMGYSSDVLSDSLHAALWMGCLAAMQRWLESTSAANGLLWSLAAGELAAFAFWTRAEAIVLPATFVLTLLACQMVRSWRLSAARIWSGGLAFSLGFAPLFVIWTITIGGLTPRPTAAMVLGQSTALTPVKPEITLSGQPITPVMTSREKQQHRDRLIEVSPSFLGTSDTPELAGEPESLAARLATAGTRTFKEFAQETRLIIWLAFLGECSWMATLLLRRRSLTESGWRWPTAAIPLTAFLLVAAMGMTLRFRVGYLSGRYLMTVLPFVTMAGAMGLERLFRSIGWWPRTAPAGWWVPSLPAPFVLVVVALASCVGKWGDALHSHRAAHRDVAQWLQVNTEPDEAIFDPSRYAAFFAGRANLAVMASDGPESRLPPRGVAVIEVPHHDSDNIVTQTSIDLLDTKGTVVAQFGGKAKHEPRLLVVEFAPAESSTSLALEQLQKGDRR